MARTPTIQIPLGYDAPNFSLPDTVSGKTLTLQDVQSDKATVVVFICNHCPYVVHIMEKLVEVADAYIAQGVAFVAISSNDVENYPADAPDKMTDFAQDYKFNFPYLYDETQEVAKAYQAACTPDFSVFDGDMKCVYRGQFDGARPNSDVPVTGEELKKALDTLLAGKPVSTAQIPSVGCNIKWKGGVSPY